MQPPWNRYISAGMTIAWLMDAWRKGCLLPRRQGSAVSECGGNAGLHWKDRPPGGDRRTSCRGICQAAEITGKGKREIHPCRKGPELPMHNQEARRVSPWGTRSPRQGLTTCNLPMTRFLSILTGCPCRNLMSLGILEPMDPLSLKPEKVRAVIYSWFSWAVLNHLGGCYFVFGPRS